MQKLDIKEIFLRNIDNFKDKNIIVGFSGGADSTALLMLFYEFKDYLKINLEAAHFNHQWRDTAINDQLFCKEFCQKLNIKLNIGYAENYQVKNLGSAEANSREQRLQFFSEFKGFYIALAHHLDDQLENIFIRLIRGTAVEGLVGILNYKELKNLKLLRPIIDCSKKDILTYCNQNNINYIIDPTNQDNKYLRNKIRNILLPVLADCDERATENILKFTKNLTEVQDFLNKIIIEKQIIIDNNLIYTNLLEAENIIKKEAIKKFLILNKYSSTISTKLIEEVLRFIENSKSKTHLIKKDFIILKQDKLIKIAKIY